MRLRIAEDQRAQIVDAVQLVGMVMGHQHAVQMRDARVDQLLAHVRRGVDQHRGLAMLRLPPHQDRAAPPPVLGLGLGSQAPQSPAPSGPPMRGTPPEEPEPRMVTSRCPLTPAAPPW